VQGSLSYQRASNHLNDRVVYTPLHGVGLPFVRAAFDAFGLPPPIAVPEQAQPDAAFPTTPFPNPEEGEGVWTLSMACGACLVRCLHAIMPVLTPASVHSRA